MFSDSVHSAGVESEDAAWPLGPRKRGQSSALENGSERAAIQPPRKITLIFIFMARIQKILVLVIVFAETQVTETYAIEILGVSELLLSQFEIS
jgi:hypothetical protein